MSEDNTDAKFIIKGLTLFVPIIKFSNSLYLNLKSQLKTKVAQQQIVKQDIQVLNIPKGTVDYFNNTLSFIQRPERLVCLLTTSNRWNGQKKLNPFLYKMSFTENSSTAIVTSANLELDGTSIVGF